MPFVDPSIIQGFQPVELPDQSNMLMKALQIQGLRQQQQLGQFQLQTQQRAADENNRLSSLLSDPTTQALPRDQLNQKIMAVAPLAGQKIIAAQYDLDKTKAETAKNNAQGANYASEVQQRGLQAAGSLAGALSQKPNLSYQDVLTAQQGLVDHGLSNGKTFSDIPPTATPDQLRQYFSQYAQSTIAADKQQTLALDRTKVAETARHDSATEANARAQVGIAAGHLAVSRQAEARQAAAQTNASLNDAALNDAATRLAHGDTSVLQNVGRGAQGGQMIAEIRNRAASIAANQGMSADAQTASMVQLGGEKAGARTLGTRTANLSVVAQELDNFGAQALQASAAVPRGQFVPLNKAIQMVQSGTSSPELAAFVAKNEAVINSFSALAGKGTPTVAGSEHARKLLSTATSPEAYAATVKALQQEAGGALSAGNEVQAMQRGRMAGQAPAAVPSGWNVQVVH